MTSAPRGRRGFPILAAFLVTAAFACSVQAKTARHLERGDGYFGQKKYREAILEYRSVLDKDPKNTRAVQRLGIAHYELGELGQSYGYLRRASETDPNDVEVRWRLGALAVLSRQMEEARRHATFVLQKAPDSVEGLALMADTAETREEVEAAVRRISEARERLRDYRGFWPQIEQQSGPALRVTENGFDVAHDLRTGFLGCRIRILCVEFQLFNAVLDGAFCAPEAAQ